MQKLLHLWKRIPRTVRWLGPPLLLGLFGFYLWYLYGQLELAFSQQEEFNPTRIYSDVTRIAAPLQRRAIEEKLRGLSYPLASQEGGKVLSFRLRTPTYPKDLLPSEHPQAQATKGQAVLLTFESSDSKAPLTEITYAGSKVEELYLEPELVATLSRSGENAKREIRDYVTYDQLPPQIWQAVIAVEDPHFLEHKGFDPRGIARAIYVNLKSLRLAQGGSTLTQQLVKNLMARRSKNLFRKLNELFLSVLLEFRYDKEQILERYLNEVYLGQVGSFEVHGVSQGAKLFFNKKLEQLTLAECAMMAGLIRGPAYYSPYRYLDRALERQKFVLKKMVDNGTIAEEEARQASAQRLRLAPPQPSSNKAPYFTDFVKAELIRVLKGRITETDIAAAGLQVYTTLDARANQHAQSAVERGLMDLEARYKIQAPEHLEGALASVDHRTGFIRALIGGRNYAQSNFNRILNMRRQVGSTFKPLVYVTAFRKGEDAAGVPYGPAYPVEDAPWTLIYDQGKQAWTPRNYEKEYRGWITMRQALALSLNTVTAHLGFDVGIPKVIESARLVGIESHLPNVPSLALGVAELSPVELLRAYATLANHGTLPELAVIRAIVSEDNPNFARLVSAPKSVIEPAVADLTTSMLTSMFDFGTAKYAKAMGWDRPSAGKTGTTSNHRDAWFAGYTPELTTVVWVGMDVSTVNGPIASPSPDLMLPLGPQDPGEDPNAPRISLTGASGALPIWVNYMKSALNGWPAQNFPESPDLTQIKIDKMTGKQAQTFCPADQVVEDWYPKNHVPAETTCGTQYPPSVVQSESK